MIQGTSLKRKYHSLLYIGLAAWILWGGSSCHSRTEKADVVPDVAQLNSRTAEHIRQEVSTLSGQALLLSSIAKDSIRINRPEEVGFFYRQEQFAPLWSDTGVFLPVADSMLAAIQHSDTDGLNPGWYHYPILNDLYQQLKTDSVARYDAVKWSAADMLLTDAFIHMANQLRFGILPPDSISLKRDSVFTDTAAYRLLAHALKSNRLSAVLDSLQPHFPQYILLCKALKDYRKKYGSRHWDTLPIDYGDTTVFEQMLAKRLLAGGLIDSVSYREHTGITGAIKTFQRSHALYPDGVPGARTIAALNRSAEYRIQQIGVNLERWRHLKDSLPEEYVWVNIPSFMLSVWNNDTAVLVSRVIAGKPGHETPLLNSSITNFQLYPYWRVPMSIIAGEMLPAIKRDTGYLRKHNLEVVDRHNNIVPLSKLHWNKYNKNYFPYVMRQMTGLDNSLGVIKFNFKNKYSVYLHDTNLRNLFNFTHRDLSHGCVRVQQWDSLARFLVRNDTLMHMADSIAAWLQLQEQKSVALKTRVPVYIRYFTCEVNARGNLIFYDDVYGYDSVMMRKIYY